PGRTLAAALDRDGLPPGCQFGCAVGFAVVWNGIVAVFVTQAVRAFAAGRPNWWMAAVLVPFVVVGLILVLLVGAAAYQWFVSLLAGRVGAEVSGHPLAPGGRYELQITQRGTFALDGVRADLVCEEAATFVAGTSSRTARKVVARHALTDPDAA